VFKIVLDAGHGKYTAGKRCLASLDPNETREWLLNARVCEKIEKKLQEYEGYKVLRVDDRSGIADITLTQRTDKANKWGADIYISVHHNAASPLIYKKINGVKCFDGSGIVAIIYNKTNDADTIDWQKRIYDSLIEHTGLKGNRATPLAKMNLHVCRETKMPCILVELGFIDSYHDVPIILTDDFADKCATAIVETIVKKAKLKRRESDIDFVQRECGFADSTIDYLCEYKYSVDLFAKIRKAIEG
jgi:N-acetylmuramoyl-L-alanine amidase